MRRTIVLLSASLITLTAGCGVGAKRHPAQPDPVRAGRPARAHRDAADRTRHGRGPRQGRQFQEFAFAVSDLHHGQRLGDGERPLPRRYRHLQQHDLYRLFRRCRPATPSSLSSRTTPCSATSTNISTATILNEETILKMARAKGFSTAAIGKLGPTLIVRPYRHRGKNTIVIDDSTGGKNGVPLSDEMKDALTKARPSAGDARRAATTARRATPRRRAPLPPTSRSRPTWPTSPARSCCRCSRRATSRSCWCSGRAIPTAASTTPATASTPSRPASTARPRWPASRTPTTIWRSCARRSTISASPPPPTS